MLKVENIQGVLLQVRGQNTILTIAIIETFSKIRELSRNIQALSTIQDNSQQRKLLRKSGDLIAETRACCNP